MIVIEHHLLKQQLQKSLYSRYFIFGNDSFLLQDSQNNIIATAKKKQFHEYFSVTLSDTTNWDYIFNFCQVLHLFTKRQILLLILPENDISLIISKQLTKLALILHDNLLLIIRSCQLTYKQKNSSWFKLLSNNAVLVNCFIKNTHNLPIWLKNCAKSMNLSLDTSANKLLCYYYEGNLLALVQVLEQLSIMYPDGYINLKRVKAIIQDNTLFTNEHLIQSILEGKSKRAIHILRNLQLKDIEPYILLRIIQKNILLLFFLKRNLSKITLFENFNKYKIVSHRRPLIMYALQRLKIQQLHSSIRIMTTIELMIKQKSNNTNLVWSYIHSLILILCGKILPNFIDSDDE